MEMKHSKLVSFVLAGVLAATLAPRVAANGQVDEILNNMQQAGRRVKSIQSDLEQEKRHTQVGGSEVHRGTLSFKRAGKGNDKLRITYRSRDQVTQDVAVVGNKIVIYQPTINQVILTSRQAQAAQNPEFNFMATPYKSVAELKAMYEIVSRGDEQVGGVNCSLLELTPKGKASFQKQTLWVSQSNWLPIRYRVWEFNGDVSTFTLGNMQINADIPDSTFNIKWKDGTREIHK